MKTKPHDAQIAVLNRATECARLDAGGWCRSHDLSQYGIGRSLKAERDAISELLDGGCLETTLGEEVTTSVTTIAKGGPDGNWTWGASQRQELWFHRITPKGLKLLVASGAARNVIERALWITRTAAIGSP